MQPADLEPLAVVWHDAWKDAHAGFVPEALERLRTKPDFLRRLRKMTNDLILAGPVGAPVGFVGIKGDEINQIFVARTARGAGVARDLLTAGEAAIRDRGHSEAKLIVIEENARARAFYTKMGWREGEIEASVVETSEGDFTLPCVVFRKTL